MIIKIKAKFLGYLFPDGRERKLLPFIWENYTFYTYRKNIETQLKENSEYELEINRKVNSGEFWKSGRIFRKLKLNIWKQKN